MLGKYFNALTVSFYLYFQFTQSLLVFLKNKMHIHTCLLHTCTHRDSYTNYAHTCIHFSHWGRWPSQEFAVTVIGFLCKSSHKRAIYENVSLNQYIIKYLYILRIKYKDQHLLGFNLRAQRFGKYTAKYSIVMVLLIRYIEEDTNFNINVTVRKYSWGTLRFVSQWK